MGLYVWVSKYCCGKEIQFQSKACKEKDWGEIELRSVPKEVAIDLDGNEEFCPICEKTYRIQVEQNKKTIPMEIVTLND